MSCVLEDQHANTQDGCFLNEQKAFHAHFKYFLFTSCVWLAIYIRDEFRLILRGPIPKDLLTRTGARPEPGIQF